VTTSDDGSEDGDGGKMYTGAGIVCDIKILNSTGDGDGDGGGDEWW